MDIQVLLITWCTFVQQLLYQVELKYTGNQVIPFAFIHPSVCGTRPPLKYALSKPGTLFVNQPLLQ